MGKAGSIQHVPQSTCDCGYPGFKTKGEAIKHRLNRQAFGASFDAPVECPHPKGKLWHVNDRGVKAFDQYVAMLAAGKHERPTRQSVVTPVVDVDRAKHETATTKASDSGPRVVDLATSGRAPSAPRLPEGCSTRKIGFASESRANTSLEEAKQADRGEVATYRCHECERWHLTSTMYTPDSIVEHEELVGDDFSMCTAMYPDGRLVSVNFRNGRSYVRVPVKFLLAVRAVIGAVLEETKVHGK